MTIMNVDGLLPLEREGQKTILKSISAEHLVFIAFNSPRLILLAKVSESTAGAWGCHASK
jgi:hypothetical protein